MTVFSVLDPFFHALSDGKIIRHTVSWVLRILAVIVALLGIVWFIAFIGIGFKGSDSGLGNRSAAVLIGCLLFSLFGLAWGYLASGVLFFRASSVKDLGDSQFTVLSVLSILFRANGELSFVTYSLLGVGACLFVWFTNFSPFSELGMLGSQIPFVETAASGFVGGLEIAIFMLLVAFVGIVISYALAELTVVWVEIALNTRSLGLAQLIRETPMPPVSVDADISPSSNGQHSAKLTERQVVLMQRICRKCSHPFEPGSMFCDECGTPVG
jgi:hypothetical protein